MAEGAPLLREYAVNPASRVRIPPSPPLQIKKAPVERLGPFLFVWCEWRFGRTLWFDKTRQRFEQAIRVSLRMAQPEGFKSPLGELNY